MLLALWAGFAGAVSVSVEPIIIPDSSLAGQGKGTNRENTYQMLSDDYWDAREASITGKMPKQEESAPVRLDTPERRAMLEAIKTASSIDDLRANSAKLKKYDGIA